MFGFGCVGWLVLVSFCGWREGVYYDMVVVYVYVWVVFWFSSLFGIVGLCFGVLCDWDYVVDF